MSEQSYLRFDFNMSAVTPEAYTAFQQQNNIDASVSIQEYAVSIVSEGYLDGPPQVETSNDPAVFTASAYGHFDHHQSFRELSSLGAYIVFCDVDENGDYYTRTEYVYGQSWEVGVDGEQIFQLLGERLRDLVQTAQQAGRSTTADELTRTPSR